jgi:hypothetical protein
MLIEAFASASDAGQRLGLVHFLLSRVMARPTRRLLPGVGAAHKMNEECKKFCRSCAAPFQERYQAIEILDWVLTGARRGTM